MKRFAHIIACAVFISATGFLTLFGQERQASDGYIFITNNEGQSIEVKVVEYRNGTVTAVLKNGLGAKIKDKDLDEASMNAVKLELSKKVVPRINLAANPSRKSKTNRTATRENTIVTRSKKFTVNIDALSPYERNIIILFASVTGGLIEVEKDSATIGNGKKFAKSIEKSAESFTTKTRELSGTDNWGNSIYSIRIEEGGDDKIEMAVFLFDSDGNFLAGKSTNKAFEDSFVRDHDDLIKANLR